MTKVIALSDQHGFLPDVPPCDLLLICGDLCPSTNHAIDFQAHWLNTKFRRWLAYIEAKKVVYIAGNHDFIFQYALDKVPRLPYTYLQDSGTTFEGLNIYGSPHQLIFFDWAFNLSEEALAEKWKLIPDNTDILVLHGPPYGLGDMAPRVNDKGYEHVGSPSLLARIKEIKPKLVVYGHLHSNDIHENYGTYHIEGLPNTTLANVSLLNDRYALVNKPTVFEL